MGRCGCYVAKPRSSGCISDLWNLVSGSGSFIHGTHFGLRLGLLPAFAPNRTVLPRIEDILHFPRGRTSFEGVHTLIKRGRRQEKQDVRGYTG